MLQQLNITTLGWGTLWPVLLIAWGLGMLLSRLIGTEYHPVAFKIKARQEGKGEVLLEIRTVKPIHLGETVRSPQDEEPASLMQPAAKRRPDRQ